VIAARLRRALTRALGRGASIEVPPARQQLDEETDRRIDAARRRLRETIPPRED
jgi:hypothetical protein